MSAKARFSIYDLAKLLQVPEWMYIDRISVQDDPHALIVYLTQAYETVTHDDGERPFASAEVGIDDEGVANVKWELP